MSYESLVKAIKDAENELFKAELELAMGDAGALIDEVEKGRPPALDGEVRTHQSGGDGDNTSISVRRKKGADGRWHREPEENIAGRTDTERLIQDSPPSGRGSNSY